MPVDIGSLAPDDPRRWEAERRRAILRFAEPFPTGAAKAAAVAREIEEPTLPSDERLVGPAPDRVTLARWAQAYEDAGRALAGLVPRPSTGRRATSMDAGLEDHLRALVRGRPGIQPAELEREARAYVEEERRTRARLVALPTYAKLRRWKRALPVDEGVLAEFGTKAARAQTKPKATIPTARANERWFVDEVSLGIVIKIVDDRGAPGPEGRYPWMEAKVKAVVVVDAHSRAILAAVPKKPTPERPFDTAFDHVEILGAIAGAMLPDLAPEELRPLAIGAPSEFRLDGSGSMGKAKASLRGLFGKEAVPNSEPNAAWVRGLIERQFRTLKRRDLAGVVGDERLFVVFDEDADPRDERQRNNHDDTRLVRYRHEVPLAMLPTWGAFCGLLRHAVRAFNATPNRTLREGTGEARTPLAVWQETAPEPQETVPLIIGAFPVHERTLTDNGLEIGGAVFNSDALHRVYGLRERLFVRRDPFDRAVWVYPLGAAARLRSAGLLVPNKRAWATALDPAAFNAEARRHYAELREQVETGRRVVVEAAIGADAAADVRADQAKRSQALAERSRTQQRIDKAKRSRRRADEQPTLPGLPSDDEVRASATPVMPRIAPGAGSDDARASSLPAPAEGPLTRSAPAPAPLPSAAQLEPVIPRATPAPARPTASPPNRRGPLKRAFRILTLDPLDPAVGE